MSTVTIYENATKDSTKRISTSSEDADTSDEMVENFLNQNANTCIIEQFIAGQREAFEDQRKVVDRDRGQPSTSRMRYQDNGNEVNQHENRAIGPDEMTEQAIKQAEASKAHILRHSR